MRSYLDIITELRATFESDTAMLLNDQKKVLKLINELFDLLWRYSD